MSIRGRGLHCAFLAGRVGSHPPAREDFPGGAPQTPAGWLRPPALPACEGLRLAGEMQDGDAVGEGDVKVQLRVFYG